MADNKLALALQRLQKHELTAITTRDRRDVLGIIAGVLVGARLPLPTSPVTELVNYYVATHEPTANSILNSANDQCFINTNKALEVARNIYLQRYKLVYEETAILTALAGGNVIKYPDFVAQDLEKVDASVIAKAAEYYF